MEANFYEVVYPGNGYRLVNIGEALQEGDEVSLMVHENPTDRFWENIIEGLFGEKVNTPDMDNPIPYGYYRRKITK